MAIVSPRTKVLFLPVIRGNYPVALTKSVKAAARSAASAVGLNAIFPADNAFSEGVIRSDADIRGYYETTWKSQIGDIKALVVISGDFMRERAVQDTARLLPTDVPIFMIVNNDNPADMGYGKVGDALCGTLSVHHNMRMIGRSITRACRINMHDAPTLKGFLADYAQIIDGIESLRNMRIGMFGVNPTEFATTFTNQIKLFELGFSLHPYELMDIFGDVVLGSQIDSGAEYKGPFGEVKLRSPIRRNDPRVAEARAAFGQAAGKLTMADPKLDMAARAYLWMKDTYEHDGLDTGAIHCWSEFGRFFGFAPCAFSMMTNLLLKKPLVCEVDICHAIMAKLGWAMTNEAPVILDINNNGWDPRIYNNFHCSQTPSNWLVGRGEIDKGGAIAGVIDATPFTAISAATTADGFRAIVFQGQMLRDNPGNRGSSGFSFVPNFPEVIKAIEGTSIHHYVAFKGHHGAAAAAALAFRGLCVEDMSVEVPQLDEIEKNVPRLNPSTASECLVFSR